MVYSPPGWLVGELGLIDVGSHQGCGGHAEDHVGAVVGDGVGRYHQ